MKKQIPAIILAIVSIALATALYSANQQIAQLEQQLAAGPTPPSAETELAQTEPAKPVEMIEAAPEPILMTMQEPAPAPEEEAGTSGQRMMKNITKMMENPAMNKIMEASQRGVIGAMYEDLVAHLGLSGGEKEYFMELLMFRQMTQVDVGMKMMSGNLSDEERKKLAAQIKEANDLVKTEMKAFLNDESDYSEFEFYEKTQGERMMLSQAEAALDGTDHSFSDETYRRLLEMMHSEKENFDFNSDFQDETNMDMSPQRFSEQNLQNFGNDLDRLNENIFSKAQNLLTAEQFEAFKSAITTTTDMQKSQLEMAAQMLGGGK